MNAGRKGPRRITRQELYDLVWAKPMVHAGTDLGISGNGLAKVCRKLDVPYPPRGYWAKLAAGKAPPAAALPERKDDIPQEAIISGGSSAGAEETPEVADARRRVAAELSNARAIIVPERLTRPHPVIAGWIEARNTRKQRARSEPDPWRRELYRGPDFTSSDRRRHRILHALFKALEHGGGRVSQNEHEQLIYQQDGEQIEFQLREKRRRVRRPLSESELRWRLASEPNWRHDLEPTGLLIFEIKTYLTAGLRREWSETETRPLEPMLGEIAATFAAAIPLLAEQRVRRKEAAKRHEEAMRLRQAEQERRQLDGARWRKFCELAASLREVQAARALLDRLRADGPDPAALAGELSLADWTEWAEAKIAAADPLARGAQGVFDEVAEVTRWSYRD